MFLDFFYTLRHHKIPVALTEWRVLMQALSLGLAHSTLERFYTLARSLLVQDVGYYDAYDLAFKETFQGITTPEETSLHSRYSVCEIWDDVSVPSKRPKMKLPTSPRTGARLGTAVSRDRPGGLPRRQETSLQPASVIQGAPHRKLALVATCPLSRAKSPP